jgi:citrate lyase gamma subunit
MKRKEVLTGTFESSRVMLRQQPKGFKIKFRLIKKLIKRLQK